MAATQPGASGLLVNLAKTYAEILGEVAEQVSASVRHVREDEEYGVDTAIRDAAGWMVVADNALGRLWTSYSPGGETEGVPTLVFFIDKDAQPQGQLAPDDKKEGAADSENTVDENSRTQKIRISFPVGVHARKMPVRQIAGDDLSDDDLSALRARVNLNRSGGDLIITIRDLGDLQLEAGMEFSTLVYVPWPNDPTALANLHLIVRSA